MGAPFHNKLKNKNPPQKKKKKNLKIKINLTNDQHGRPVLETTFLKVSEPLKRKVGWEQNGLIMKMMELTF